MSKEKVSAHPRQAMLLDLARSGLGDKDAKKMGIEVLGSEDVFTITGKYKARAAKFPYFDHRGRETDYFRLRFLDDVRGFGAKKSLRYWQPAKTLPQAYFCPLIDWAEVLEDTNTEIWFTEGEKKAAAACKAGVYCIGLGGVWSWRSTKGRQPLIPDLALVKWAKRQVRLCFDTDADPNPSVTGALEMFGHIMEQRGAVVSLIKLPLLGDADKTGLDDFLVSEGKAALSKIEPEAMSSGAVLLQLNEELAVIDEPSSVLRLSTGQLFTDPSRLAALHYGHRRVPTIDAAGRMVDANAVAEWLKWPHHRRFTGVAYEPGQPHALDDGRYNFWKGWPRTPKKGNVKMFTDLIDYQLAGVKEHKKWFLQWMAYPVQHPGAKLYGAVVLWSQMTGTGKTLLAYTLGRVYGSAFSVITESQLHGSFNSWQAKKQLILGEEISGSERVLESNRLKHILTGETVTINSKYQAEYDVRNVANFMFTTNHHDAFLLEKFDRRFFVVEVGKGAELPAQSWFDAYDAWYRTESAAAAIHAYLESIDLTGFNPRARVPVTQDKLDMMGASLSETDILVQRMLDAPDAVLRIGDSVIGRDLYELTELLQLLDPDKRYRTLTISQLQKSLRRTGCTRAGCVRTTRGPLNLWVVRNNEKWATATHAEKAAHYNGAIVVPKPDKF